ncbi:hypothetical protein T10_8734 [Trichinella papuae]|uniref:Uncharacterized protein n=1 Tax=Trichinella papuae TaxID=268474 RepID=A0A0V1MN17_9BILA|nr:hypothetical protein T10_8734 [Trichinella papuae]
MVLMSQTLVLVQVPTQLLRTTLSAKSFQFHRDSAFLMSMSQCAECGLGYFSKYSEILGSVRVRFIDYRHTVFTDAYHASRRLLMQWWMFLVQLEKRRSWMIEPPPVYICFEGASIQAPGRQRNWRQDKSDQNRPLERAEQSWLVKGARQRLRASMSKRRKEQRGDAGDSTDSAAVQGRRDSLLAVEQAGYGGALHDVHE